MGEFLQKEMHVFFAENEAKDMEIQDKRIDHGKAFDWGRTSQDYARYRDIYPEAFYAKIRECGLCRPGQTLLDLGTGTGVLPRHLAAYGGSWIAADISENQIAQAKQLSRDLPIQYLVCAGEDLRFPENTFDGITACQCFWYFQHETMAPLLSHMLKPGGKFLALVMEWLPGEDAVAAASEEMILKYNPLWSGSGETMHPIAIPDCYKQVLHVNGHEEFLLDVPFTRESWHGRIRACRGIGASLPEEKLEQWEQEHWEMLCRIAPAQFTVRHYAALAELEKK